MRVLVISAHPDDETIGAGGTLLRHIDNGDKIYWCIVTQGYSPPWSEDHLNKSREQIDTVHQAYGFEKYFLLGFPVVKLNSVPHIELTSALQKVVREVAPQVVYIPPQGDINNDHNVVFDASLVAARPLPDSSVERILSFEIGPTSRYGVRGFIPNVFVNIEAYLDKKLGIMAYYERELREFPHPRSLHGLRLIAEERGLSVGVKAAEAFQLIREIH